MDRRTLLLTAGSLSVATLAGCFASEDDTSGTSRGVPRDDGDHGALAAVGTYIQARLDQDRDTMADAMHPYHPYRPDPVDEDDEDGVPIQSVGIESYDVALVDENFDPETIRDDPLFESHLQASDVTPDELFEGEEAALVRVTTETTDQGEQTDHLIVLTDDGEWKVFWFYPCENLS